MSVIFSRCRFSHRARLTIPGRAQSTLVFATITQKIYLQADALSLIRSVVVEVGL
jgi:hypothetical protein